MLTFDEEKHEYRVDGHIVPSVTQIIKWAGLIGSQWYTEEARDIGTEVHLATQYCDDPEYDVDLDELDDRVRPYVEAWIRFRDETKFWPNGIEARYCFSVDGNRYAGTLDREGRMFGAFCVIDIKTGQPESWHQIQTAAYASMGDYELHRVAVYLSSDGKYKLERHTDNADYDAWRSLLSGYYAMQPFENWKANNAH
jgi:hypothetical protein